MILEHFISEEQFQDPDLVAFDNLEDIAQAKTPQDELRKLKSASGGLLLAYKLMSRDCLQYARILYIVTKGCWTWYSSQVKSVQTPGDAIKDLVAIIQRGWGNDPHLSETVRLSLQDAENLVYMGVEEGASVIASRLFTLTVALVSHRGWSMTHRCHGPPECYVGILPLAATQGLCKAEAASTMRRHWQRLLKLEQRRLTYGPAKQLWNDISVARNSAIRAMYCLFERDQFRPNSTDGCHLLRGLLEVLPDNKIVEDSHNVIRADSTRCKSDKRNVTRIQDVNFRRVPHLARVTRDDFVRNFKAARPVDSKSRYHSSRHRLPAVQAHVMGKKTWPTVSEQWLRRSAAAWQWLQVGSIVPCDNAGTLPRIDSALFSRLSSIESVMMRGDGKLFMCLGHAEWAFLSWPIDTVATDADSFRTLRLSTVAGVTLEHIVDPLTWHVVPFAVMRHSGSGVFLQQTSAPVPLLRHSFATPSSISHDDLQRLADLLQVDRRGQRAELLARVVGAVDISLVEGALVADKVAVVRRSTADKLLDDGLFEAAFDQLDDNDKRLEFREIIQEQERKRCRAKNALRKVTFAVDRRKAKKCKRKAPLLQRRVKKARHAAEVQAVPSAEAGGAPLDVPEAASPPPDVPAADPPPAAAPEEVANVGPAGEAASAAAAVVARLARGVPCGQFIIAGAHRRGTLEAVTCTCLLHKQGDRCNKSLTLGYMYTEEEAIMRIKEWCARGLDIEDSATARKEHMAINPRNFRVSDLRSVAELERLVGPVGPLP